jgi:hypothetical protein
MMLDIDPKIKKKKGPAFFELEESLDEEWIKEHQQFLVEEQRQKIRKKFEKDNEKLRAEGEKEMKVKELEERLEAAKELEDRFKKENKTKKVEAEGKNPTIEKLENNLLKLDQRIENMSLQAEDKENNKEVALGTSKIVSQLRGTESSRPSFTWKSKAKFYKCRTTLTLVLPSSSPRNLMSLLRGFSPRLYVRSSIGPLNPSTRIGNFEFPFTHYRPVSFNSAFLSHLWLCFLQPFNFIHVPVYSRNRLRLFSG